VEDHEHALCKVGAHLSDTISPGDLAAALPDDENLTGVERPIFRRGGFTQDRSADATEILAD
jgi:hypothetical protein